jgi:cytochrome oxidase Cu insertion factor (SCO1/SenC/PrrC family)
MRIRSRHILIAAACLTVCSCRARHEQPISIDDLGPVGEFALTERNGDTVRDSDLRGKVWVASFVFTRCTGPCPQVSATIARLQSELKDEADVRFVTFTVDPEHDDPRELAEYAKHFGADPKRWLFLTGKQDDIYRLLREGFHVPVEQNTGDARRPGNEVMHSPKLVVVDRRGHIRGYFDGMRDVREADPEKAYEDNLKRVRQAVAALVREAP